MNLQKGKLILEIDGVSYPAHDSLGAMVRFKETTGKEVNEISGISDSIVWLWCCVKSASAKTDHPLTMDFMEFADSCDMETLQAWTAQQQPASGGGTAKKKPTKGK